MFDPTLEANIHAQASNLKGQFKDIEMRKIVANERISYIGLFDVGHREYVDFVIDVRPQGRDETFTVRFREQFFTRRP